jgi:hypothetical protein
VKIVEVAAAYNGLIFIDYLRNFRDATISTIGQNCQVIKPYHHHIGNIDRRPANLKHEP